MNERATACLAALLNPHTPFSQAIARQYPTHETYIHARQILSTLRTTLHGAGTQIRFSAHCPIPAQIAALAAHYVTTGERSTLIVHARSTIRYLASAVLPALRDTPVGSATITVSHHPDPFSFLDHDRLIHLLTKPPAYITQNHIATLRIICENAYTTFSEMSQDGVILPPGLYPEDLCLTSLSTRTARFAYESARTAHPPSDITLTTRTTCKTRSTPIVAIAAENATRTNSPTPRQNIILSHYENIARRLLTGHDTARAIFHLRKASKLHKNNPTCLPTSNIRNHIAQASDILDHARLSARETDISSTLLQKELHNLRRWVTLSSHEDNQRQSIIHLNTNRTVLAVT